MRWVLQNRLLASGVALVVVATALTISLRGGGQHSTQTHVAGTGPSAEGTAQGRTTGTAPAFAAPGESGSFGATGGGSGAPILPGFPSGPRAAACTKKKVNEVGVTDSTITLGQVITDNPQLPQQFKPLNEGLQAFVNLYNATGGLCGRKLKIEYRNDNLNPATHENDTQSVANSAFAFVANGSLLDFLDYGRQPPFDPMVRGGGSFVPDVGGFALSYGRSQSSWFAGVIGSPSPVLSPDGAQFKFLAADARAHGNACRKAGMVYLREPTNSSQDQATLGVTAMEQSWGGGMGGGKATLYAANLEDPEPAYEALVAHMAADGVNCVFTWTDVASSVNLVTAMFNRGLWPPDKCKLGPQCFSIVWSTLAVYDQRFLQLAGDAARGVSTTIPEAMLDDASNLAVKVYVDALKTVHGAEPSSFSVFGFTSGLMLVQALQACPATPTRTCLIGELRKMHDFTAGGLLGGVTPFRRTRVTYSNYGTFGWKWLFNHSIEARVVHRRGKSTYVRIDPGAGFLTDTMHIARGTPG